MSPYVPLSALLILSLVAAAGAGAVALDGLPDGGLGLVFMIIALFGVRPQGVVVAAPGWLLAARIASLVLVGVLVALFAVGRRAVRGEDAHPGGR